MNAKKNQNKLIQRLLKIGKKHKVLVYPILALVAVISFFSYLYRWAASSGKRVVAAVLVGVLVISQSYFMTSSANESDLVEEEQLIDITGMDDDEQDDLVDSAEADASADEAADAQSAGSPAPADAEDPADYRDGQAQTGTKDPSGEKPASEGGDSEGSVKVDTYSAEGGKASITAVAFINPAQETVIDLPTGSISESSVKAKLPQRIRCTIQPTVGEAKTMDLDVSWTGDKGFASTMNGYVIRYTPNIKTASSYEQITEDIQNLVISVRFFTKYTIQFNKKGQLTGGNFLFDAGQKIPDYGYCGTTYTLPSVDRPKSDGSGQFTFEGWYYDDGTKAGDGGAQFVVTDATVTSVKLTARFKEAEVQFTDTKHETQYRYPDRGSSYAPDWEPASVWGYHFKGWLSGNTVVDAEHPIANVDDTVLTASWQALSYDIEYYANRDADLGSGQTDPTVNKKYGDNVKFAACGYTRFGYRFVGWSDTQMTSPLGHDEPVPALLGENTPVSDDWLAGKFEYEGNPDKLTIRLYAVWQEVRIVYADNTIEKSISSTYGEPISESYGLYNGESSGKSFSVTNVIAEVNGTSFNPNLSNDYFDGSVISAGGEKMSVQGTPKTYWGDGVMKLTITVSDIKAGTSDDLILNITTQKKELEIESVTVPDKVYDGNNQLTAEGKTGLQVALKGVYNDDDVSVDMGSLTAYYNDKNAGSKTLKLSNISLSGTKSGNYIIVDACDVENAANITKKPLALTLEGRIYKYSGEKAADPSSQEFILDYAKNVSQDDAKALVIADGGLKNPDGSPNSNVLTITYTVPGGNEQQEYDIEVLVRSENYNVDCSATCKLVVTQDPAIEKKDGVDGNYSISGKYNEETGWYNDVVTIRPEEMQIGHGSDYYNQILRVGEQEWGSEIQIDDDSELNATEIQVFMRNSRTGAYTGDSEKLVFKVDSRAPEYAGATFTPAESTSLLENIGNFFKYGNFFKESVSATMSFTDNKSGCDKIYYSLSGVSDTEDQSEWASTSLKDDSITLTIPLGTNNEVYFYVTDKAGNKSEVMKLLGNADGSEWVIERENPVITGYHIANKEGDRISNLSSGGWYNQEVQVVAEVKESGSGIRHADWYINGAVERLTEDSFVRGAENTTVSVAYPFSNSGIYEVSLDVSDNAKNSSGVSDLTTIKIDLDAPRIELDESQLPGSWAQSVNVRFTVTDDVSGIYKVSVIQPEGPSYDIRPDENGIYAFTAATGGQYTIIARDEANNESTRVLDFDYISKEIPKNALVTWSPENPNGTNNWYNVKAAATITPVAGSGRAPVTTYYKLWKGDAEPAEATAVNEAVTVTIPEDGVWTLRVWAETAAGVKSEGEYCQTVYVDTTTPEVMVTDVKAETAYQTVKFTVKDALSGVNVNQIKVVNGAATIASKITKLADGSGYEGTFTVSSAGNYVVQAADMAGNVSQSSTYSPMTLKVKAIKNITGTTATIGSVTRRGTYAVATVKYEYRKAGNSKYKEITPYAVKDEDGNVTASYAFRNLKTNTKYYYRITTTSVIGEALTYTGSFKTAGASGIGITGRVVDADDASSMITVSLLEGNTVLKTTEVKSGSSFVFNKVADGNYNITATNGMTSKTISVNIYKGKLIDPKGDILIALRNGMTTSLVMNGSKTPNISVSGLEDIFAYDTVNFTDADRKFIAEGGTVEFRLNVSYKSSGAVTQSALKAIYGLMSGDEKVNMFLDLTLNKIRTYASGTVESNKQVKQLAGGVSLKIVVPMSEKVVKASKKSVIRVHGNKASLLADLDASANSYTINTNKFSTYALTYKSTGNGGGGNGGGNSDPAVDGTGKKTGEKTGGKSIKDYDASPKTGDGSPLEALSGLLVVSLAGMAVLKKKGKK